MDGWQGLLTSFGLNGISDIGHNIGYVLAMLPDMLVGLFTGKTKSINLKDNMMPIASIVTGMFVKNPILKMILIGMGGLNLLNKAGHETLDDFKAHQHPEAGNSPVNYRVYPDEPLNPRIVNPQIRSNCLIATMDKNGLPIGLQLIGDCFKEKNIIRAAYSFEKTRELKRSTIAEEYSNKNTADTNKSAGAQ